MHRLRTVAYGIGLNWTAILTGRVWKRYLLKIDLAEINYKKRKQIINPDIFMIDERMMLENLALDG